MGFIFNNILLIYEDILPYFFFLGWDRDGKLEKIFTGQPFFNSVEFPPILQLCSHLPAWMLWNCSCKDCVTHLFPSNIFYYQFSFFFYPGIDCTCFHPCLSVMCRNKWYFSDLYCKLWHLHHVFDLFCAWAFSVSLKLFRMSCSFITVMHFVPL